MDKWMVVHADSLRVQILQSPDVKRFRGPAQLNPKKASTTTTHILHEAKPAGTLRLVWATSSCNSDSFQPNGSRDAVVGGSLQ